MQAPTRTQQLVSFYKQLCERAELFIRKAPSCGVCTDHAMCFGSEDAQAPPATELLQVQVLQHARRARQKTLPARVGRFLQPFVFRRYATAEVVCPGMR